MQRNEIIYFAIVTVIGLVILEGAARYLVSRQTPEPVVPGHLSQFNETLGWSLKPNARGTSRRLGYPVSYKINSKGLRDSETTYQKPKGVYRIVLLGDSRTFGFGIPIDKHFSTLLEGHFHKVEVINMGVSGYGIDQELLLLQTEGVKYQPDLVIAYVAHYGDHRHMHTRRFGKEKPRFILKGNQLVLTNSPVADIRKIKEAEEKSAFKKMIIWLYRNSKLFELVHGGIERIVVGKPQKQEALTQKQEEEINETNPEFMAQLKKLGVALLTAIQKEARQNGAKFVLITSAPDLYPAAVKKGILSLDVSDVLNKREYQLPEEFSHISELGNEVLALHLARFIIQHNLIPAKHIKP